MAQGAGRHLPPPELRSVRLRLGERHQRPAILRGYPRACEHRRGVPGCQHESARFRRCCGLRAWSQGGRPRTGRACVHDRRPVTKISGVGTKTAEVLERVGVRTIGELARFKGADLKKLLGKNAVWLWGIARGLEQLPVEERPDPKSISVERTFERDVADWSQVETTLRDVAHNVFLRAKAQGATFRTIGIKIRLEGFQTHLRERTLPSNVLDEDVLAAVCGELLSEFADKAHRVRLVGVRVTKLERPKTSQPRLTSFE